MPLEVERKFLVEEPPAWLGDHPSGEIDQGYLALDGDTEVRIRRHGGVCSLTIKRGGGLVRTEVDIEIDRERFEALWPLTEGRRVSKTRHLVPTGKLHFDLDVYAGDLAGLVVAEIEFASVEESESFAPPDWLGLEVTEDGRYKNRALAERGRPR